MSGPRTLLLVAAALAGCGPGTTDDPGRPTFTRVFNEVLGPRCSGRFCHGSATGGGLVLVGRADAHRALVGVAAGGAACGSSGSLRVAPGDPDASLLVQKLEGAAGCGTEMPPGARLADADLALIRAWIEAGAPLD